MNEILAAMDTVKYALLTETFVPNPLPSLVVYIIRLFLCQ